MVCMHLFYHAVHGNGSYKLYGHGSYKVPTCMAVVPIRFLPVSPWNDAGIVTGLSVFS